MENAYSSGHSEGRFSPTKKVKGILPALLGRMWSGINCHDTYLRIKRNFYNIFIHKKIMNNKDPQIIFLGLRGRTSVQTSEIRISTVSYTLQKYKLMFL